MKVNHVWIEGYRNLRKTDFAVGDRLVLIGENNSGKSNLLRALTYPMSAGGEVMYTRPMSPRDLNDSDKTDYYKFLEDHVSDLTTTEVPLEVQKKFQAVIPKVIIRLQFEVDQRSMYYFEKLSTQDDEGNIVYQLEYRYQIQDISKLLDHVRTIMHAREKDSTSLLKFQINLLPSNLYKSSILVPKKGEQVTYDLLKNLKTFSLVAERDGFSSIRSKVGSSAIIELLNRNINDESKLNIESGYHDFFDQVKESAKMDQVFNWPKYAIDYTNADKFLGEISILPNMPPINTLLNSVQLGYAHEPLSQQGLGYRNLVYLMAMINALEDDNENPYAALTLEEPEAHLSNENQKLLMSFLDATSKQAVNVQLMYSTHNTNFLSKDALQEVVVMNDGNAVSLSTALHPECLSYLMRNPNMDIYKLLFSTNVILVEGISEELLIKAYLRVHSNELNNIEVLSFHKGFNKILDLWSRINLNSSRKIAVIRDFDNQPNAKQEANKRIIPGKVYIGTTKGYTLEDDIVSENFELLKQFFNKQLSWKLSQDATEKELSDRWKSGKAETMAEVAYALGTDIFQDFKLPEHISRALDFFEGKTNEID